MMKGYLILSKKIDIDPESIKVGGSWTGEPIDDVPTTWDMNLIKFFFNKLKNYSNPKFLDIGANTGSYCLLSALDKNIKCWTFEPQEKIYQILQRNILLNNIEDNVEAFQIGLSDRNHNCKLHVPKNNKTGLANIGNPTRFTEYDSHDITVRTLDSLVKEGIIPSVDMIKIDTEGCELFVLKGAEKYIRENMPDLLVEFLYKNTIQFDYHPREIMELLKSWGYKKFTPMSIGEDIYVEES